MRLYFLRHAEANDGLDDDRRALSSRGIEQAKAIGNFLSNGGVRIDVAYCSPLVRARQTADHVMRIAAASKSAKTEVVDALLNGVADQAFSRWLKSLPEHPRLLLVGHAPSISDHARALLGMRSPCGLDLPKGGLICVETEDRETGTLRLMVTPKQLGCS